MNPILKTLVRISLIALVTGLGALIVPSAAQADVEWYGDARVAPSYIEPGERGGVSVWIGNSGTTDAEALPDVEIELPPGITATGEVDPETGWSCVGAGSTVTCENMFAPFFPFLQPAAATYSFGVLSFVIEADPAAQEGSYETTIQFSGGGSPTSTTISVPIRISEGPTPFGALEGTFEAVALDESGNVLTDAGARPAYAHTGFEMNVEFSDPAEGNPWLEIANVSGVLKDVVVDLPPGFVGNPSAVTKCPGFGELFAGRCPADSQVGVAKFMQLPIPGYKMGAVYNMEPDAGLPAQFAFQSPGGAVTLTPILRSDGDWGLSVKARDTNEGNPLFGASVTLWGVPAHPRHDRQRCPRPNIVSDECSGKDSLGSDGSGEHYYQPTSSSSPPTAFLSNPTRCSGSELVTRMHLSSWDDPAAWGPNGEPDLSDPRWASTAYTSASVDGCEKLDFSPVASVEFSSVGTGEPSGMTFELKVPQNQSPDALATPHVRAVTVDLPDGVMVNASSVRGLEGCSASQVGLLSGKGEAPRFSLGSGNCPDSSKIGTVTIATPLLVEPLEGGIFVADQRDHPFNSLIGLYIAVDGPGIVMKLAGEVELDPSSGKVRTIFRDNPQLPFETLTVRLIGGPDAPLVTPVECGTYETAMTVSPWSQPATGPADEISAQSTFSTGPGGSACGSEGGFSPTLSAGTTTPIAGEFSPFVMQLTRRDGEQELRSVSITLPEGLTGKLASIPYCPEVALARFVGSVSTGLGTAQSEIDSPSCQAASLVGRVTVGAGAGPRPFYLETSRVYLSGPYGGAPLSLAIITPVKAGPFDLGTVMVRSALHVNERTAQIQVASDEIPTILEGIPLQIKDLRVLMDRDQFTLNPTSCAEKQVSAQAAGASNALVSVANRFQVADCAALGFAPRFGMRIMNKGRRSTLRSFNPAMRFVVAPRSGETNIGRAAVTLPSSIILDQGNLDTICTRAQFAARACPQGSVVGFARAWSPLLERPVQGWVYLGSSTNPLPDLIADLRGQVNIVLQGRIDSTRGRIRNIFNVVPDVPVTRFQLNMRGGKQRGILVNSTDQCRSGERGVVNFEGHDGKRHRIRPRIALAFKGCRQIRQRAARSAKAQQEKQRALKLAQVRRAG